MIAEFGFRIAELKKHWLPPAKGKESTMSRSPDEMKNRTKTNQDREITLCPRALGVLRAQLALRERMVAAGLINHNFVFFSAVGEPLETTYLPYNRWTEVLETLPVRFRKPYNARHSYTSWRLMISAIAGSSGPTRPPVFVTPPPSASSDRPTGRLSC